MGDNTAKPCSYKKCGSKFFLYWTSQLMKRQQQLILLFLLIFLKSFSQDFYSINYTVKNGLPSNEVYDIDIDEKGFLWVATDRGAARYDGYSFVPYTVNEGLTDNTVFYFKTDRDGKRWFMLSNGTFCYLEKDSIHAFPYNDSLTKYLPGKKYPRFLSFSENQSVKIGYMFSGIVEINKDGKIKKTKTPRRGGQIAFHAEEQGNELILGSVYPSGKYRDSFNLYLKTKIFDTVITFYDDVRSHIIKACRINEHQLLIGISKTLFVISDHHIALIKLDKPVVSLNHLPNGDLWLGTFNGGAKKIQLENNSLIVTDSCLPDLTVAKIQKDHEGGTWVATLERGLFYVPDPGLRKVKLPGKDDIQVSALTGARGKIYFGTMKGEIFSGKDYNFSEIKTTGPNALTSKISVLYYDEKNDDVWFSLNFPMGIINTKDKIDYVKMGYAWDIIHKGEGTLLMATSNGVMEVSERKMNKLYLKCDGTTVRMNAVVYTSTGKIFAAGTDGLFEVKDNCLQPVTQVNEKIRCRINCMIELPGKEIAFATIGKGIIIWNGENFDQISSFDGLKSNNINKLALDNTGLLWVGTDQGLSSIKINKGKIQVRNFNLGTSLLSVQVNSIYCQDQQMWLGTDEGLVRFDSLKINRKVMEIPVYIEKLLIKNISYEYDTSALILQYDQNEVRINFTGLRYNRTKDIGYRFRITENDEWKFTNSRSIFFPSLSPGNYSITIQARNWNGEWSNKTARINFIIKKPFWQETWFSVIVFALFSLMVLLLFNRRLSQLRKKDKLLKEVTELKQQALFAQMSPHFAFNTLNSIQTSILKDERKTAIQNIGKFSTLMRRILEESRLKHVDIEREINTLTLYLEMNQLRFKEKFNYRFEIESAELYRCKIPSMLIQPLIENSIRHGFETMTGEISIVVSFFTRNNNLYCSVIDNGIGFKKNLEKKSSLSGEHQSSGTSILKDRLLLYSKETGQEFFFEMKDISEEGKGLQGTIITFIIPVIKD